jgi:hypothetical protein
VALVGDRLATASRRIIAAGTQWIALTDAPAVLNYQFVVTNSVTGQAMFYRLSK